MGIDQTRVDRDPMASKSALVVTWEGAYNYGGWGKGVGANIELDRESDFINFRVLFPSTNMKVETMKVIIAEDDNEDAVLEEDADDTFSCQVHILEKDHWQLISLPLKDFKDENTGGDGVLNVTRRGGLHTITFVFDQPESYAQGQKWYFDFVNISDELPDNGTLFH
jgi:hypothetical protein